MLTKNVQLIGYGNAYQKEWDSNSYNLLFFQRKNKVKYELLKNISDEFIDIPKNPNREIQSHINSLIKEYYLSWNSEPIEFKDEFEDELKRESLGNRLDLWLSVFFSGRKNISLANVKDTQDDFILEFKIDDVLFKFEYTYVPFKISIKSFGKHKDSWLCTNNYRMDVWSIINFIWQTLK